jgi:hypothetical protein
MGDFAELYTFIGKKEPRHRNDDRESLQTGNNACDDVTEHNIPAC